MLCDSQKRLIKINHCQPPTALRVLSAYFHLSDNIHWLVFVDLMPIWLWFCLLSCIRRVFQWTPITKYTPYTLRAKSVSSDGHAARRSDPLGSRMFLVEILCAIRPILLFAKQLNMHCIKSRSAPWYVEWTLCECDKEHWEIPICWGRHRIVR